MNAQLCIYENTYTTGLRQISKIIANRCCMYSYNLCMQKAMNFAHTKKNNELSICKYIICLISKSIIAPAIL